MDVRKRGKSVLNPYRDEILALYFDEGWKLQRIKQHISEKHGISASDRQYKWLLDSKNSGRSKNISSQHWHHILSAVKARQNEGKKTEVFWDGKAIDPKKIEREFARYNPRLRPRSRMPAFSNRVLIRTPLISRSPSPICPPIITDGDTVGVNVPSDAMSENDYGSLSVLSRELYLSGIPVFGRRVYIVPIESDQHISHTLQNQEYIMLLSEIPPPGIPRPPFHTWSWESLTSILCSPKLKHCRAVVASFPTAMSELSFCSKEALLNMAINTIASYKYNGVMHLIELLSWFTSDSQEDLLKQILKSRSEQILSFVWKFIYVVSLPMVSNSIELPRLQHAVKLVFTLVENSLGGFLTHKVVSSLISISFHLNIPEIVLNILTSKNGLNLIDEFHLEWTFLKWMSFNFSGSTVPILLDYDASSRPLIKALFFVLEKNLFDSDSHLETLLRQISSHRISQGLLDWSNAKFSPFTLGEVFAFRSSSPGLLLPYITDPLSLEICTLLAHFSGNPSQKVDWIHSSKRNSLADELALLGAVRFSKIDLAESLLRFGVDPNCAHLRMRRETSVSRDFSNVIIPAEKRFFTWAEGKPSLPLQFAFQYNNTLAVRCLLENGARFWERHQTTLRNEWDNIQPLFTFHLEKLSQYLRFMAPLVPIFFEPDHLHYTGQTLLFFAIATYNAPLIQSLTRAGVRVDRPMNAIEYDALEGFNEPNIFIDHDTPRYKLISTHEVSQQYEYEYGESQITPLTCALLFGRIHTVEILWALEARFTQSLPFSGSFESCVVYVNALSSCVVDLDEKLHFLVEHNACFEATTYLTETGVIRCTSLQAVLLSIDTERNCPDSKTIAKAMHMVKKLLDEGVDVNAIQSDWATPLQHAFRICSFDLIKLLVDHGADVNIYREPYKPPFQYICDGRTYTTLETRDLNSCGFSDVCMEPLEALMYLASSGADIDQFYEDHATPLATACYFGQLDIVRYLIKHGASVHVESDFEDWVEVPGDFIWNGRGSPLHHTCASKENTEVSVQIAQLLLDEGVEVNPDPEPFTPLQLAIINGHFNLVLLLLQYGADVNAVCCEPFESTITLAASIGILDIVKMLINAGANDHQNEGCFAYAINIAAKEGHFDVAKYLSDIAVRDMESRD